jgi:hypothetical protein
LETKDRLETRMSRMAEPEEAEQAVQAAEAFLIDGTFRDLLRCNDPRISAVPHDFRVEYRSFDTELQGNTHVKYIGLDINELIDYDQCCAQPSHEDGRSYEDCLVRQGAKHAEPFLRYIRESPVLQALVMEDDTDYDSDWSISIMRRVTSRLARFFFEAMTENTLNSVQVLCLGRWSYLEYSEDLFAGLLQRQVLRRLHISLGTNDEYSPLMETAFASNTSLECLLLDTQDNEAVYDVNVPIVILKQLHSHPRLRELLICVTCGEDDKEMYEALAALLKATKSLERLTLGIWLDDEQAQCFVDGLRWNRTLTRLSLNAASSIFVEYLLSSVDEPGCLRELEYGGRGLDLLAQSLVTPPQISCPASPTLVGSSLRMVKLSLHCKAAEIVEFLHGLCANPYLIRLERLHLPIESASFDALVTCVPSLFFLKELEVKMDPARRLKISNLVAALERNGSLCKVLLSAPHWSTVPFPSKALKLIDVYGERNRALPVLLSRGRTSTSTSPLSIYSKVDTCDLHLLPAFLRAAARARNVAPNNFLLGLLSALDDIGPQQKAKRGRSWRVCRKSA